MFIVATRSGNNSCLCSRYCAITVATVFDANGTASYKAVAAIAIAQIATTAAIKFFV
jgi:hypothetical protein